jgi:hypothetical protein
MPSARGTSIPQYINSLFTVSVAINYAELYGLALKTTDDYIGVKNRIVELLEQLNISVNEISTHIAETCIQKAMNEKLKKIKRLPRHTIKV